MNTDSQPQDYYCNQKFWWLSLDLAKKRYYSCCAATPQKIDITWLKQNPGELFNNPDLVQERKDMLNGIPVKSCEASCWLPESRGLTTSRRLVDQGYIRSHSDIKSKPQHINLVLGNHCNLTCVYCCKQYSSAWARDVMDNGEYLSRSDDRYRLNAFDKLLLGSNQSEMFEADSTQAVINEVAMISKSTDDLTIHITGGEPLLHNSLLTLIDSSSPSTKIIIFSGLGISQSRLENILAKLQGKNNVTFSISAESVGSIYEIVRYGNSWQKFTRNLDLIKNAGFDYCFSGTISNLNVMGIPDFEDWAGDVKIDYSYVTDPSFLSLHVLDADTKNHILENLVRYPQHLRDTIKHAIIVNYTPDQKKDFVEFFKDFSQRRGIDFSVYPESFRSWINKG